MSTLEVAVLALDGKSGRIGWTYQIARLRVLTAHLGA